MCVHLTFTQEVKAGDSLAITYNVSPAARKYPYTHKIFVHVIATAFGNDAYKMHIPDDVWKLSCDPEIVMEGKREVHAELLAFIATAVCLTLFPPTLLSLCFLG